MRNNAVLICPHLSGVKHVRRNTVRPAVDIVYINRGDFSFEITTVARNIANVLKTIAADYTLRGPAVKLFAGDRGSRPGGGLV
jgi:hypothetical protein